MTKHVTGHFTAATVAVTIALMASLPASAAASFTITIKSLTGQTFVLDVEAEEKVASVKLKVEAKGGGPAAQQRLIFTGKNLEDERTLADYGIGEGATLHLVLRQR
jgi:hypothetical protein